MLFFINHQKKMNKMNFQNVTHNVLPKKHEKAVGQDGQLC